MGSMITPLPAVGSKRPASCTPGSDAPFTSFIVGKLIELHAGEFKAMVREVPQMDVQSHTYSHIPLKTIVFEPSTEYLNVRPFAAGPGTDQARAVTVVPGESLGVIRSELDKTRNLIKDVCGVDCIGISRTRRILPWTQ